MNLFLKLFLCLLAFLSQSAYSHQYDAGYSVSSNESVEFESKSFGYDGSLNFYACCENYLNNDVHAKTQTGSFFALLGDFIVTKGIGQAKSSFQYDKKILCQMEKRGWDNKSIDDILVNPSRTVQWKDTRWDPKIGGRRDDPATAYIRNDGHYVVRNNKTEEIVQISNTTKPNWKAPWD